MKEQWKAQILSTAEENMEELCSIRTYLYENPEVGGEEEKSSAILIKTLRKHGFEVTEDFHGISYAFRAVYDSGKPGASIGFTVEYDALPLMGHGCGHDLIVTAPMGAAFALKSIMEETGGKIVVFGTPGEECLMTKVQLSEEGAFEEVDVAMTVHPNPVNMASGRATAVDALQIEFYGKSSHAGAAPADGINALDAAVHCYSLIGFEKQYIKDANIYGVFVDGGEKSSMIPDHASIKYLLRAWDMQTLERARDMVQRCAKAAAEAVGATYKIWRNEPANKNLVTNHTMSEVFNQYYEALGGGKMPHIDSGGSTDMGDVSHVVPAIHPWVGMDCPQYQMHSKEFADMTITEAGDNIIRRGAAALALTGMEILSNPQLLADIKAEFAAAEK